jgi:hypothetical protein
LKSEWPWIGTLTANTSAKSNCIQRCTAIFTLVHLIPVRTLSRPFFPISYSLNFPLSRTESAWMLDFLQQSVLYAHSIIPSGFSQFS